MTNLLPPHKINFLSNRIQLFYIEQELNHISEYSFNIKKINEVELEKFQKNIDVEASKLSDDEKDEYYEANQEDYEKYSEIFNSLSINSMFIIAYACFESGLYKICADLSSNLNNENKIRNIKSEGIIDKIFKFFNKSMKFNIDLNSLLSKIS